MRHAGGDHGTIAAERIAAAVAVPRERTEPMDRAQFESFYQRNAPALRGYLFRALGAGDDTDDIVQESFCRLLRTPLATDDEGQQRAYLYRIAHNLAMDRHRRGRREDDRPAASDSGAGLPEPAAPSGDHELRRDLARNFARLARQERSLIWLAYVEGWDHAEIAERLGLRTGSIKVLLFRARQRLAALLKPRGRDGGKP